MEEANKLICDALIFASGYCIKGITSVDDDDDFGGIDSILHDNGPDISYVIEPHLDPVH